MADQRIALSERPITGPGAASIKYDILTGLLVLAAQGDPVEARLALRLSLVITARYNWRRQSFAVGLTELARLWGVTDRTAKREMAEMRRREWITLEIPAARGRVARHRIEIETVLRATMALWPAVGPDFAARMTAAPEPELPSNVVPFQPPEGDWGQAARYLEAQDPAAYRAWFAALKPVETGPEGWILEAPSRFIAGYVETHFTMRILAALAAVGAQTREIRVIAAG